MTAALLLIALGCTPTDADPVSDALAPWPDDPDALIALCGTQPFPELITTCRVQAAANLGRAGRSDDARTQCALIPAGTWREECHFRAGEELGRAGHTVEALGHCVDAGWFGRNCLTHAGWNLPRDPSLTSAAPASTVESAGLELISQVDQALSGAEDGLQGEGRDILLARFGYNLYVGSGQANPAAAHVDDPLGVAMRTGFAIEAMRLLPTPDPAAVMAIWNGHRPPPNGDPLPEGHRIGRYTPPILPDHERGIPHLPVYGGGMRLVGETPDEDALIATLEALFWLPDSDVATLLPYIDDPRPRVSWTAARLFRLAPSPTLDQEPVLTELAATHPDPGVRWHAQDALDKRTFDDVPPPRRGAPKPSGR